ncbi:MAG: nickel pincer cofactor biosynthesis protein LarB [Acidobacteriota bacterium]|nr:nickel pincer cofactor biosynthesis protein LarB [Acidobacteriota bacterium]
MREDGLRELLAAVAEGELSLDAACERLRELPYADLGSAKLDLHRELRSGAPEAIFARGKSDRDLAAIVARMIDDAGRVLVTRVTPEQATLLSARHQGADYDDVARVWSVGRFDAGDWCLGLLSAGTADLPVAEEAAVCGAWLGAKVDRHYDVGIAGVHRLLDRLAEIRRASVLIVAAGMDGALPTLVAGLVAAPVIAVPTSVGYGASFDGLAALLTMLNACSPGVAVVNIDNGYGAASLAHRIQGC